MAATAVQLDELVKSLKGPIVIFGASGFIGSNLMRAILQRRSDCFGVTHQAFVPWRLVDLPREQVLYADVNHQEEVAALFDRYGFQTIFCLHAYGGYARQKDPTTIYQTNFIGLWNIVAAASERGFAALVQGGSQSEYGTNCAAPGEDAPLKPNSHYAVSKASAGYLLYFLAQSQKLPVVNLRYYSVFGPYEESDRLIARLVSEGIKGSYPPFVDPEISRDFVYIDDAVEATLLAATVGVKVAPGESFNIASGHRTTIRQVADAAQRIFGIKGEPQWATMSNRFWDLKEWWGNPARAKKVLGWQASTSFEQGLVKTRDWHLSHGTPEIASLIKIDAPPRLSAVIACYKDGDAIPIMYERLVAVFRKLKVDYEIIFVNDASPDHSSQVLGKIAAGDKHVTVIEHSRNFGSQSAFISGMELSTGDAVVVLDGDLQDPPELIEEFFAKWREGFEVVFGRRVKREATLAMRICYQAFYRLFRMMSYVPIPADAGDFSLMDRKVVREMLAMPETDQFLRGLRAWVGFRQIGVDYHRPERMFGRSTNNLRRNLWWARKAIFSFSFVPLELMLYAGIALTVVSFLLGALQIAAKLMGADVPHGISTIIVLVLFFGGLQILAMSILGEYLGKVFEEAKRRPKFIRRAITVGGAEIRSADEIVKVVRERQRVA